MTKRSTIRYAAKQCYQLALMRAIYSSTQVGLACVYRPALRTVAVTDLSTGNVHIVPVPASWASL